MNTSPQSPLVGVFWMVVTGLCFVAVTGIVKHVGGDVPPAQAAFLRYIFGLIFVLPMIVRLWGTPIAKSDFVLFGIRGASHTIAVILWFYAMTQIPIAEVTAMNYLSPVYVTVGAAFLLGETFALRRILAVVAALVGALIILRPGVRELGSGHLAMLFTPVLFAVGYIITKQQSDRIPPSVIVAMLSITVTIGLAPFAFAVWVPVTPSQLGWLALVAAFATTAHYTMTLAFRAAPVSVTQPVTFLQLIWATLLGALLFNEPADQWVILGGLIIISAISYISWREARLRRGVTPTPSETKL